MICGVEERKRKREKKTSVRFSILQKKKTRRERKVETFSNAREGPGPGGRSCCARRRRLWHSDGSLCPLSCFGSWRRRLFPLARRRRRRRSCRRFRLELSCLFFFFLFLSVLPSTAVVRLLLHPGAERRRPPPDLDPADPVPLVRRLVRPLVPPLVKDPVFGEERRVGPGGAGLLGDGAERAGEARDLLLGELARAGFGVDAGGEEDLERKRGERKREEEFFLRFFASEG